MFAMHEKQKRKNFARRCNRGVMLLEVVVAAAILLAVATIVGKFLVALSIQRQSAAARTTALHTLNNLVEQVQAEPWDQVDDTITQRLSIPSEVEQQLRTAELRADIKLESDPIDAKRVTLRLSWNDPQSSHESSAVLTTWVFPRRGEQP